MGFADRLQQRLGGGSSFDQRLSERFATPDVGVTLEGLDADAAAAEQSRFQPWSGPDQIPLQQSSSAGQPQWSGDALDTLADAGARASNAMYFGYGDEAVGALMGDQARDNVRNRMQLAKERSPGWSMAGDIAGGAVPAIATGGINAAATRALPLAGRVAAGMGLAGEQAALSASGYADDGDRWQAAKDAAPIGAALGGASELGASAVQGVGNWAQNTAAPWMRDQGLLNRAASTGKPMGALVKEFGDRQGVIGAGQFMEDNGMTSWSPKSLQSNLDDYTSMRTGDQRNFLDELAQNPNAYPVDVSMSPTGLPGSNKPGVAADLLDRGYAQSALAAPTAQTQGAQYIKAADNLANVAPSGQMPFEDAWRNRQGFDQGAKWNMGEGGDKGLAAVNRDAANGLRGAMGDALDNTSPELRPRWESIQSDLSNSIGLGGGDNAALGREFSGAPSPMQLGPMAAATAGGPVGYTATLGAKIGGRGMMADALGGGSAALDWLGSQGGIAGDMTSGAGMTSAQQYGENEGVKQSRGYLLPQAAQQMMQQPGSLGQYEKQFWDAANSPDSNALSQLITKLSRTDMQFRATVLPKLQQLTAEGY